MGVIASREEAPAGVANVNAATMTAAISKPTIETRRDIALSLVSVCYCGLLLESGSQSVNGIIHVRSTLCGMKKCRSVPSADNTRPGRVGERDIMMLPRPGEHIRSGNSAIVGMGNSRAAAIPASALDSWYVYMISLRADAVLVIVGVGEGCRNSVVRRS